jgi:hypothetical protein
MCEVPHKIMNRAADYNFIKRKGKDKHFQMMLEEYFFRKWHIKFSFISLINIFDLYLTSNTVKTYFKAQN